MKKLYTTKVTKRMSGHLTYRRIDVRMKMSQSPFLTLLKTKEQKNRGLDKRETTARMRATAKFICYSLKWSNQSICVNEPKFKQVFLHLFGYGFLEPLQIMQWLSRAYICCF